MGKDVLGEDMRWAVADVADHRALLVYGDGHFLRHTRWKGTDAPGPSNVLTLLEAGGTRVFSIWTNTTVELERLQRDIAS